jgi:hypothetical protein
MRGELLGCMSTRKDMVLVRPSLGRADWLDLAHRTDKQQENCEH